jgi:hypothetical protein
MIETIPVEVDVLLKAAICPLVTVQKKPSVLALIFMLDDCAVHDTEVPSPMASQPCTSLQT